jgi:hypothetical protein
MLSLFKKDRIKLIEQNHYNAVIFIYKLYGTFQIFPALEKLVFLI